ncbi:RNA polymerase sigma factor [Pedobacter yulinensis]|nr:sigma-70 family RNA polymerase sigma factor [Pedobacter yulinensis]
MELVAYLATQDHAAFTEIYDRHWRSLFVYAQIILKDKEEAADVVQDIFTTLWNRSADLNIANLKSYLLIAVRNQALKAIHKTNRADVYAAELAACFDRDACNTDDAFNLRELCSIIDRAVENMPATMRAVYIKTKYEELSHQSIAEELGITEHSSRTMLNRAMNSLRTKLSPLLSLLLFFCKI